MTVGGYADAAVAVSWLAACDCVVIPSRMESIPVVFSDALQMGRPLIASDVGDMGTLLRAHPAGLVVPPEDATALCAAMLQMAAGDRSRYAPRIQELAAQFDVTKVAARVDQTSAVARRARGALRDRQAHGGSSSASPS